MRTWRQIALLIGTAVSASCGGRELPPEGQFVVHVETDAPLPAAYGTPPTSSLVPLFDRLSFEVFPAGESDPCVACTREFEVDESMVDEGRASMGVIPPRGAQGVRVRIRLFRGILDAPAPRQASTIERVIRLPPAPAEGVQHVRVMLRTEEVGLPVGTLDSPEAAELGMPRTGVVGTWPGSSREECTTEAGPDEACIPGGPFWMGDPRLDLAGAADYQGANERLVVLAPFFLDATEVTVAAFRASGLAERDADGDVFNPKPASPGSFCTYADQATAGESLPVNCLTWRLADAYCKQMGKRLPTEAELAYASSALGRSSHVWGEDPPACDDVVFERGTSGSQCASRGTGPAAVGSAKRDRLDVASGSVLDLAGNVMELASDFWQLDAESCWAGAGVLRNPKCDVPSDLDLIGRAVRGGDFGSPPMFLRAALRTRIEGESKAVSELVGFRCARSDP